MYRFFVLLFLILFLSCESDTTGAVSQDDSPNQISNADIIRNPITSEGEVDTTNIAIMSFEESRYEFGRVKSGEVVKKNFKFTNTGNAPLLISDARSTCGCTVADYPKHLIMPGKEGTIEVEFDTKNKSGKQHKPVTLTANTYPAKTHVVMRGVVEE